jgi:hypothetical protein
VAERERAAKPTRVAVVGVSEAAVCGVRDYAAVLTETLVAEGVSASTHWLTRTQSSLPAARAEMAGWASTLERELRAAAPDLVLLHYSVFAYSYRGVPVFASRVVRALRAPGAPVISILHEIVYPFSKRGWRAKVWALSQRLLLIGVMRASDAVLVTADFRARWLASRRWLPRRPSALAPVHSALPPPRGEDRERFANRTLGLFGYANQGASASIVLDALAALRESYPDAQLVLLGAPGAESAAGEEWLELARARGVAEAVSFSGTLPAAELSEALATCEVLLFADEGGPASRKSSLAAVLASGRPVVALDGPRRWQQLVDAAAISLVAPVPESLARAVRGLLADRLERDELGARGQRFARERMSPVAGARAIFDLFSQVRA